MTKDRVTYFSDHDGSIWMFRSRFIEVMGASRIVCDTLADALELYHIKLFVDKNLLKSTFDDNEWEEYQRKIKTVPEILAHFFKDVTGPELVKGYGDLDFSHHQSFWDMLDGLGLTTKLSNEEFSLLLDNNIYSLSLVLRCKKIVKAKNDFLNNYMMMHPESLEMVLSQKVEQHEKDFRPYFFPSNLDVDALLERYIDMSAPNPNYLRMVQNAKKGELSVAPDLKIKAKNKIQELYERSKANRIDFSSQFGIEFSDKFENVKTLVVEDDGTQILRYNSDFFLNKDYVGIVASLGTVFEYLDSDKLITLVKKDEEAILFEKFLVKSRSEYAPNNVFCYKNGIAVAQLACLDNLMKSSGRNIELAIESFFNEYIKNMLGLPFNDISLLKNGNWKDRAKVLIPHFDMIVKQYDLFVTHRQVNPDLMEYYPGIPVTDAKSLVKMKYCQSVQNVVELNTINYLLFSDQSMLSYVDPYKEKHYNTLYEILSKETVKYDSYLEYQRVRIDLLVNNGYVEITNEGILTFPNKHKIDVLYALYHNQVCSFWRRSPEQRKYMLELIEKGWAVWDNHLLSKPERDFFSYYLNDRQFSDAESLRNRILHGVVDDVTVNEYYKLLLLLVLLILKIDDDLKQYMAILNTDS